MSFNKRYFDKEKIFQFGKSCGFEDFNRWIVKPDAHISVDSFSLYFLELYFELDSEGRLFLYLSLERCEEFVLDFMKCMKVCKNKNNTKDHSKGIKKYVDLFFIKWPDAQFTYKKILK